MCPKTFFFKLISQNLANGFGKKWECCDNRFLLSIFFHILIKICETKLLDGKIFVHLETITTTNNIFKVHCV
jgi:hypothetical protein